MWPLSISEIFDACQAASSPVAPALAKENVIYAVTDSRSVVPHCLFVAIRGERFDGHAFVKDCLERGAALALVDANWAGLTSLPAPLRERCLAVPDVVVAYRRLTHFLRRRFTFPIFAVGGSNGKTTTKEILAALLSGQSHYVPKTQKSENGFLGIAQTLNAAAKAAPRVPDALVLEIGIDAVGAMTQHAKMATPAVVMLTALEPEHVAGFGTSAKAAAEEFLLFTDCPDAIHVWQTQEPKLLVRERLSTLRPQDVLVVEEEEIDQVKQALKGAGVPASITQKIHVLVWRAEEDAERRAIRLEYTWGQGRDALAPISLEQEKAMWLPLLGHHNAANFGLALGAALAHGVSFADLLAGLGNFQPPPQRSNIIDLPNGGILIDDSYNASPASMRSGLDLLARHEWHHRAKFLFLGDMAELGDESRAWHLALVPAILAIPGAHVYLYGDEMAAVYQTLGPSLAANKVTATYLPKSADPTAFLTGMAALPPQAVVLIKGSRSMQLERLVPPLTALARI